MITYTIRLENTDVVANPLFLVLGNTLRYPGDVTDFLFALVSSVICRLLDVRTCSRSFTHAYTMPWVNWWVNASFEISISFW